MYLECSVKFSPRRSSNTFFRSNGMQWLQGRSGGRARLVVHCVRQNPDSNRCRAFHAMITFIPPTPTFDGTERVRG